MHRENLESLIPILMSILHDFRVYNYMSMLMSKLDFGMLMSMPIYVSKSCNMLMNMLTSILHYFCVYMSVLISVADFGMLISTLIYVPKSCQMLMSILHDFRYSL